MHIVLFGGTGHLGREIVRAVPGDMTLTVASRRPGASGARSGLRWAVADLETGRGLEQAVAGAEAVVFAAGHPRRHVEVEVTGLSRLLCASRRAGVRHFLFVSIVGVDRIPLPYYGTKLRAETLVAESGLGFSILRATQFHYFVDLLLGVLGRVPLVMPVPRGFRVQPVAEAEVAREILQGLRRGPTGEVRNFAGPEVLTVRHAAELWLAARGRRQAVLEVPLPGRIAAALRGGHNTDPGAARGQVRWADWLRSSSRSAAPSSVAVEPCPTGGRA